MRALLAQTKILSDSRVIFAEYKSLMFSIALIAD
jgi:hypothetical protein